MSPERTELLITGNYYHVFVRSIAKFVVFNDQFEYSRMMSLLNLYRHKDFNYKYSKFLTLSPSTQAGIIKDIENSNSVSAEILAYCLMPTHIHLILEQVEEDGIVKYIGRVLNGYSKYFNIKHKRQGPLWSSRFKNITVFKDEQLLHLTRYIHLNSVSAEIVNKPEGWKYSSYHQYVGDDKESGRLQCNFDQVLDINPKEYKKFVLDQKNYQSELSRIKLMLIDYTG